MTKKTPPERGPRKPPEPSPLELSAFVHGEESSGASDPPEGSRRSTPKKQVYQDQPEKVTVYLQPELAKHLRIHAATSGASVSFVAQEALRQYLAALSGDKPTGP